MQKTFIILITSVVLILSLISLGFKGEGDKNQSRKVSVNDNYQFIAVNQILMWISNNGDGSHDPRTDGNGFYWPGGLNATKSAIFEDGLIFGGKIGRETRVNGNTHRQGLQAGKILPDGTPDDPGLEKYRVYKISKGWEGLPPGPERDAREKDYLEWPGEDGAPYIDVDGDNFFTRGIDLPRYLGDETLWYVTNDLDPLRSTFTYGTLPMGLEFQTTVFGFKRTGALGDMVFKKYTVINKGQNTIRDMILGYWSDTDMGDAADDYTGCDTVLSLGYTYNATNSDGTYGTPPPAIGYDFFQGPIVKSDIPTDTAKFLGVWRNSATINNQLVSGIRNLPMTAFTFYINGNASYRDPAQGLATGSNEFYNYLSGKRWDGEPYIDPNTSEEVLFVLSGDVVEGTGWYEGAGWPSGPPAGDRRHLMASGPFNMAPGDTQEIVVGIVAAIGGDNIQSITSLKIKDRAAQLAYDFDFNLTPSPPDPKVSTVSEDGSITLWWSDIAETYNEFDPLLPDTLKFNVAGNNYAIPVTPENKYFKFEGYRIWQFEDETGTNPQLLGTYDKINDVGEIRDFINEYLTINGSPITTDPYVAGFNAGLRRFIKITKDAFTNGPLFNGNPYYFAVTSYGYSKYSDPPVLESPPVIREIRPGKPPIDAKIPYNVGEDIGLKQVSGRGDGLVKLQVIDPFRLTNHDYRVEISGTFSSDTSYNLIDLATNDTLITNDKGFLYSAQDKFFEWVLDDADIIGKKVTDAFLLTVQQVAVDSINNIDPPGQNRKFADSYVKGVYEIKNSSGDVSPPLDVFNLNNSTNNWKITGVNSSRTLYNYKENLNWGQRLGWRDYEIRFTGSSQFYLLSKPEASYSSGTVYKGVGTVPFQIWDVGNNRDTEPKQLMVRIADLDRDSTWSKDAVTGFWEPIYAVSTTTPYAEPLADSIFGASVSTTFNAPTRRFGRVAIDGDVPAAGTVILVEGYQPLSTGDVFEGKAVGPTLNDVQLAANNIDQISVFPNPYLGANSLERDKYQRFMRFTNLPSFATIRIYSLGGTFIRRIEKSDPQNQYVDWDLRNNDGLPVASGVYLAYLDLPGVGSKILKLAVIMETQFIDRL